MRIISIEQFPNGAHENQTISGILPEIPDGWAVIPDGMEIPDTFPFVDIEVEGQVVVGMTAGVVPEPEPEPEPEPGPIEVLQAENKLLAAKVQALSEQNDFQEELIVELANIVYA